MRPVIILFAKAPIPGQVKTRLVPPLTPDEAASLHQSFVLDTVARFHALGRMDIELHTDTSTDAWPELKVTRKLQIAGNLGLRMFHSLNTALQHRRCAVIVGTDAPTLPVPFVEHLVDSTSDVALGPTEDGGFYAIAARRTHPNMFDSVMWSSSDTLQLTVAAIRRSGLQVEIGSSWFDIDEPRDLERLRISGDLPPRTAAWFASSRAYWSPER